MAVNPAIITSLHGNLLGLMSDQSLGVTGGVSFLDSTYGLLLGQVRMASQALKTNVYTIPDMGANATFVMRTTTAAANGLIPGPLPIQHAKSATGLTLLATTAAGNFAITQTLGTTAVLTSETANNNTKTDIATWEIVLPQNYIAGSNINVVVNVGYALNGGTVGTKTIAAAAYLNTIAGLQGASLIATAAQALSATAATAYTFVITGTTLVPGSRLTLSATLVLQETAAGGGIIGTLNSIQIS